MRTLDIGNLNYTKIRVHKKAKLRIRITSFEIDVSVSVHEGRKKIGSLNGILCEGGARHMAWTADALDCRGPITIQKLLALHPAIEHVPCLYLSGLKAEGKGRKIGLLMINELNRVIDRCAFEYLPILCGYAYPGQPIPLTATNTTRLINYYRKSGAINPCRDRRVLVWDPNDILDFHDIALTDLGPTRPRRKPQPPFNMPRERSNK